MYPKKPRGGFRLAVLCIGRQAVASEAAQKKACKQRQDPGSGNLRLPGRLRASDPGVEVCLTAIEANGVAAQGTLQGFRPVIG